MFRTGCASLHHRLPPHSQTLGGTTEGTRFSALGKQPKLSMAYAISLVASTPKLDIEFTKEFRLSSLRESNRHFIGDQHSDDLARPGHVRSCPNYRHRAALRQPALCANNDRIARRSKISTYLGARFRVVFPEHDPLASAPGRR